jgi:RHS repeat-associated protein
LGNGLSYSRTLNDRLYPRELKYALGAQAQLRLQYSYDENGNVSRIDDLRSGGNDTQTFGYDNLDRLTSGSGPYGNASFEYDAFDNIRRHVLGTRDLRYTYADGSNRLTSITLPDNTPVLSYLYNSRGAITSAGPAQLTFDLAETVTQYNGPSGLESYLYDANGHRIQVASSSGIQYPVYTRDGLLRAEYGTQTQTYYYLGTQLIARSGIGQRLDLIFSSGFEALVGSSMMNAIKSFLDKAAQSVVTNWYLNDHLGSNIATADASGAIIERSQFAPFGERWGENTERGPGYAGHFEDATGMTYMKARYYGGIVGRFISPDPVGVDAATGGNFNRYWYGNNNPQKFVDPDGRNAVTKLIKQTIKHKGDVIQSIWDVGGDLVSVFAPSSTPMDRIEAAISLVSPVDLGDIKAAKDSLLKVKKWWRGRKGGVDTRAQNMATSDTIRQRGGDVDAGFGNREARFTTDDGKVRYSDGSARDQAGQQFEFQSVDTAADGLPSASETAAAVDVARTAKAPVVCVSKKKCS